MSPQERALIDAIRDDPDDDLRRLVYADWLEEQGQAERAELIRVQIELGKRPGARNLLARERELLDKHRRAWLRPLNAPAMRFVRGMAEGNLPTLADFRAWAEKVSAWAEKVSRRGWPSRVVECNVRLTEWSLEDAAVVCLVGSPLYPFVTRLDIESGQDLTAAAARAIAAARGSANLLGLSLQRDNLRDAGARALASSPYLKRLRRLDMSLSRFGPKGLAAVANSKRLEDLRELVLDGAAATEGALIALVQARGLRRLTSLLLTQNNIGDARLRLLLTAPFISQLTELVLAGNAIRDGGAKALAACPALASLKRLNLNGNQIGDEGAIALLESPHLQGLDELSLDYNRKITEPVRRRIKGRFGPKDGDEP